MHKIPFPKKSKPQEEGKEGKREGERKEKGKGKEKKKKEKGKGICGKKRIVGNCCDL